MSESEPPAGLKAPPSGFLRPPEPYTVFFELESGGKTIATAHTTRQFMAAGVAQIDVHDAGLIGKFFLPALQKKAPAVIVLGGSEGGLESAQIGAMLLASHGFAALALAYFRAPGLPPQLVNIPLEYLKQGIGWLRSRSEVDGERIGVLGFSRGAELALLTAATFPEIKAVVAYGPSNVVWPGISSSRHDPAWTYRGKPVPFVHETPSDFSKEFEKMRYAAIPVERIKGGVLLISGKDDHLWPSSLMADQIIARLQEAGFKFPFKQLSYDRAGHLINFPYLPTPSRVTLGGTAFGLAQADADSWPRVLHFLAESLNK